MKPRSTHTAPHSSSPSCPSPFQVHGLVRAGEVVRVKALSKGGTQTLITRHSTGLHTLSSTPSSLPFWNPMVHGFHPTVRLMENHVGNRARGWQHCPPPLSNPAGLCSHTPPPGPSTDPGKTLTPSGKMFCPCHSPTQANPTKLQGLPRAWLGSLLLPRKLLLARRRAAARWAQPRSS